MTGIRRVVPNISSDHFDETRKFYTELFGFEVVMDMGWIVTLASPDNPTAQLSIVRGEPADAGSDVVTVTVEVGDVDDVHATAVRLRRRISYPLTDEPWGVRRFHLRDPNGVLINVMSHRP